MANMQSNESHKTLKNTPQLPDERGLTDDKLKEIRQIGDPPYEQEESDIM